MAKIERFFTTICLDSRGVSDKFLEAQLPLNSVLSIEPNLEMEASLILPITPTCNNKLTLELIIAEGRNKQKGRSSLVLPRSLKIEYGFIF